MRFYLYRPYEQIRVCTDSLMWCVSDSLGKLRISTYDDNWWVSTIRIRLED